MIASMTGYGKAACTIKNIRVNIEVTSINSKNLDLNLMLPAFIKHKEPDFRNLLAHNLQRGRIDFKIGYEYKGIDKHIPFNTPLISRYNANLKALYKQLGLQYPKDPMSLLLNLPEIFIKQEVPISKIEFSKILSASKKAIKDLVKFRNTEGAIIEHDMITRINKIVQLTMSIERMEEGRVNKERNRIKEQLSKLKSGITYDKDRFEQELVYYLDKVDITEEKVRLKAHCEYFIKTVHGSQSHGKKLGFIAQEIGREINTLGAKANDAGMQRNIVEQKEELEKIKEQLFNVL